MVTLNNRFESSSLKFRMNELNQPLVNRRQLDLSAIAMFIGAALQHPVPPCNGTCKRSSTISITQYKQKFNEIRIYCELANSQLVNELFVELGGVGEPTDEFKRQAFINDARHYRDCYLSMTRLLTQDDAESVTCAADYRELLCSDLKELDTYIDYARKSYADGSFPQHLTHLTKLYGGESFDDVRNIIIEICAFKKD